MSLLQDLVNGKELQLSNASKITIAYEADANALSISIGGNKCILSSEDVLKIIQIFSILRTAKTLEAKV